MLVFNQNIVYCMPPYPDIYLWYDMQQMNNELFTRAEQRKCVCDCVRMHVHMHLCVCDSEIKQRRALLKDAMFWWTSNKPLL